MPDWLIQFADDFPYASKLAGSVAVVIAALMLRWVLRRSIRIADIPSLELRRRWILQIRTLTLTVIFLGIVIIWATELRTVAISLVAIIVALVLATKELISCITGSFMKIGARAFTLGDRITVGEVCGDVIDQTLLSTTLMEVGPGINSPQYTGRTVVVPNSLFLITHLTRETPIGRFVIVTLTVPLGRGADLAAAERVLLDACREACEPYMDRVERDARHVEKTEGIEPPSVTPRVTVVTVDDKRMDLLVRFPAPITDRREIEQTILRRFLDTECKASGEGGGAPT